MNCPRRWAMRAASTSVEPCRKMTFTGVPAAAANFWRYIFLGAEQDAIPPWLLSHSTFMALPIMASHGQRSASFNALPADIFSMLEGGCSLSPSMKRQFNFAASRSPTLVLPLLVTPITLTPHVHLLQPGG